MKRLFIVASLAILAIACQKTEVQNLVTNEIGFSAENGKLTRAIVTGKTYSIDQPFAVLAYSHQGNATTLVMPETEVSYGTSWKASVGSYYWPNDASTTMNFYAFSPAISGTETNNLPYHQKMNGDVVTDYESNTDGIQDPNGVYINNYVHRNMYVDFMVADDVTNATFSTTQGVVPVVFRHKMAQVAFNVDLTAAYSDVTFTLESITLNQINSTGQVTDGDLAVNGNTVQNYLIFPAKKETDENGAPALEADQSATRITKVQTGHSISTIPVTMIPQTIYAKEGDAAPTVNKTFTVVYTITGAGVATETVTKTISLASENTLWDANKSYVYNLTIGMNEITFTPSVVLWDDADSDGEIEDGEVPVPVIIPVE